MSGRIATIFVLFPMIDNLCFTLNFFVYTMPLPDTLIVYISMPTGFFHLGVHVPFYLHF